MAKIAARNKDDRVAQKKLAAAVCDYKDAQAQLGATVNHKDWPTIPNSLSRRLRSLDTQLNSAGIAIRWPTSHRGGRKIIVEKIEGHRPKDAAEESSSSTQSSSPGLKNKGKSGDDDFSVDYDLRPDSSPVASVDPDDLPFLEDEPEYHAPSPDPQHMHGLHKERTAPEPRGWERE
jgi:hypothetical protein